MATPDVTTQPPRGTRLGRTDRMRRLGTEAKHALKTTEFYAYVVTFVLILIAGNSIESAEGGPDRFAADDVWLFITILTVGYMISRGLAKSGSRDYTDDLERTSPRNGQDNR